MNSAQNGVDFPWSKRRDGYKLSKRRAMGDDEGDDDHQQLYTYGTGKRLKMMLRVQTPAN